MICASLGRVELHLGRRMPRTELLWPVHYLAYALRRDTVNLNPISLPVAQWTDGRKLKTILCQRSAFRLTVTLTFDL